VRQTTSEWEHVTGERCAGSEGDDREGDDRGGEIERERPKRPHSFYFDSASGVLLPYLSLNLSVLELALTLPLRRLALCRCLDTWGKGKVPDAERSVKAISIVRREIVCDYQPIVGGVFSFASARNTAAAP
jgi:hypothetical protein